MTSGTGFGKDECGDVIDAGPKVKEPIPANSEIGITPFKPGVVANTLGGIVSLASCSGHGGQAAYGNARAARKPVPLAGQCN
jgi:hypothetical protein